MLLSTATLLVGPLLAADKKLKDTTIKGEIVELGDDRLSLKSKKDTVTIVLNQKSRILMGKTEVPVPAMKRGMKVTVVGQSGDSGVIVAREVRLPSPPQQPTMPSGHGGHSGHVH
jgi:hypothetical protein